MSYMKHLSMEIDRLLCIELMGAEADRMVRMCDDPMWAPIKPKTWQDECPSPNHIKTYTGRWVDPLNVRAEDVDIRDIAHSLARQCRFNGHCDRFVSVAEHSIWVSRITKTPCAGGACRCSGCTKIKLWALLHDAAEAYIGDIPRPIKQHLFVKKSPAGDLCKVENQLLRKIAGRFGLPWPMPLVVKDADNKSLNFEFSKYMMGHGYGTPAACTPTAIESEFLKEFTKLGGVQ